MSWAGAGGVGRYRYRGGWVSFPHIWGVGSLDAMDVVWRELVRSMGCVIGQRGVYANLQSTPLFHQSPFNHQVWMYLYLYAIQCSRNEES